MEKMWLDRIQMDLWLEEGELLKLLENPRVEVKEEAGFIPAAEELEQEILVLPTEPGEELVIEGVHERVQVELYQEAKEAEAI